MVIAIDKFEMTRLLLIEAFADRVMRSMAAMC